MNALTRFFQFLSKTDPQVVNSQHCSRLVRMTQTSLGVIVLITGVFAFVSAGFAVYTAFGDALLAVVVGALWGSMIVVFDREIVSSADKRAVLLRLPLALIIGFAVSVPLELRLLQDRLDKYLRQQELAENAGAVERKNAQFERFQARRDQLEKDVLKYREQVAYWGSMMEAEVVGRVKEGRTGKAGEGPAWRAAKENRETNQRLLNETLGQLQELTAKEAEVRGLAEKDFNREFVGQTYGLLSRYEALEGLKSESSAALKISWLLRLLFIFVEVFPALLKLFLPYNAYHAILEARRREAIQLVHFITNQRMTAIGNNQLPQVPLMNTINQTPHNPIP